MRQRQFPILGESLTSESTSSRIDNDNGKDNECDSKYNLTLVLVDHYDSYTYNLFHMLAALCQQPPIVLAKDAWHEWQQCQMHVDGVILSPGPGTPHCENDMGLSLQLIRDNPDLCILGVCLGHQALGHCYNATVTCAPCGPVHGQVRQVHFDSTIITTMINTTTTTTASCPLWTNMSSPMAVTRYHSLVVQLDEDAIQNNKNDILPTAWCLDAHPDDLTAHQTVPIVMGLRHRHHPHYGVQFHPESIGTEQGMQLLRNFCEICTKTKLQKQRRNDDDGDDDGDERIRHVADDDDHATPPASSWSPPPIPLMSSSLSSGGVNDAPLPKYQVLVQKLAWPDRRDSADPPTPERVFSQLYGSHPHAVWLDSGSLSHSSSSWSIADHSRQGMARCSILAAVDGPLSGRVEYYGKEFPSSRRGLRTYRMGTTRSICHENVDILTYLRKHLSQYRVEDFAWVNSAGEIVLDSDKKESPLPFDYRGGFLGYLGYDVRHDAQRQLERQEHGHQSHDPYHKDIVSSPDVPSSVFLFADQSLVYDHWSKEWYLLGVAKVGRPDSVLAWMRRTRTALFDMSTIRDASSCVSITSVPRIPSGSFAHPRVSFVPNRSQATYEDNIATCHEQIRLGESYELCLTNQLETRVPAVAAHSGTRRTPLQLYHVLRRRNPAPFSAFLNYQHSGELHEGASLSICCSSPERFVSVKRKADSFQVEAKPIKGTCARDVLPDGRPRDVLEDLRWAQKLEQSVKNRAENLMIVDLLRHDLSRVCQVGSVHVPRLMQIESYATVHQMVSTIRGTLEESKTAMDVLTACFPGGSMTGAPKRRTMEILDGLEQSVSRGPYSGCLGYLSLNGSMDMNIVIRSAVVTFDKNEDAYKVSIGAGGAITALSDSEDEYEEMMLKARAVMEAVQMWSDMDQGSEEIRAGLQPLVSNSTSIVA